MKKMVNKPCVSLSIIGAIKIEWKKICSKKGNEFIFCKILASELTALGNGDWTLRLAVPPDRHILNLSHLWGHFFWKPRRLLQFTTSDNHSHSILLSTKKNRKNENYTVNIPSITFPNTTCLLSSQSHFVQVRKNWQPLVFGPELAIDRYPGPRCFKLKFSSSNLSP